MKTIILSDKRSIVDSEKALRKFLLKDKIYEED